jgi:hypothetical protein
LPARTGGGGSLTNGMLLVVRDGVGEGSTTSIASAGGLTPFLDEPASPDNDDAAQQQQQLLCRPRGSSSNNEHRNRTYSSADDKFLPEERAMIERLMMRVKECGEVLARALEEDDDDDKEEEYIGTTTTTTIANE